MSELKETFFDLIEEARQQKQSVGFHFYDGPNLVVAARESGPSGNILIMDGANPCELFISIDPKSLERILPDIFECMDRDSAVRVFEEIIRRCGKQASEAP